MRDKPRTVYDALKLYGHDMDYIPTRIPTPTAARPGSIEKLSILRKRVEDGEDLYHFGDETIVADRDTVIELIRYSRTCAEILRDERKLAGYKPSKGR